MRKILITKKEQFKLNIQGQLDFAKLKGIKLHFYKVKKNTFYKIEIIPDVITEDDYLFQAFLKDMGSEIHAWDIPDEVYFDIEDEVCREDKDLISIIESYKGDTTKSTLKVVEIPLDVDYNIVSSDWDGEYIEEVHRTWH